MPKKNQNMVKIIQIKHLWLFFNQSENSRPFEAFPYLKNSYLRSTKNFFFTLLLHFLNLVAAEYSTFYLCISESIQFYDFQLQEVK